MTTTRVSSVPQTWWAIDNPTHDPTEHSPVYDCYPVLRDGQCVALIKDDRPSQHHAPGDPPKLGTWHILQVGTLKILHLSDTLPQARAWASDNL